MDSFLETRRRSDPAQVARIKGWVIEHFGVPGDTPVLVTELRCTEEGCPPLETVIAIMDSPGERRQYKLHLPLAEVTADDLAELVREPQHRHD
jgi:hypothetical protein